MYNASPTGILQMKKKDLYDEIHLEPDDTEDEDEEFVRWQKKSADVMEYIISTRLTYRQREIIMLYYYEGKRQQEIAEELGVTESNVSHIKRRALKRLEYDLNLIRS